MTTYYCHTIEEALRRAKKAGRMPGCFYGGIILKSGKRGFAVYREGKVVERYSVIGRPVAGPAEFGFQRQAGPAEFGFQRQGSGREGACPQG